VMKNKNLLLNI